MKRLSIFGLTVTLLMSGIAMSTVSAQAASVSIDCAKVKAKVLAYEVKEKDFSIQYAPVNGKWSWFFSSAHLNDYWSLQKKIVDFEVTLSTYELNNLACFTSKQKEYAKVVYREWKDLQVFLKTQPDWISGFSFAPIVWDSIYDKDLVTPVL